MLLQQCDQPLMPHKVIREAIVNAVMHRDYQVSQPTLVVRYSNRLEIRNAGYSLKPTSMLGEMGSKLRNPIIASVLYDLSFAETKGSGIRTMQRLLHEASLSAPVFVSSQANQFTAIYLLHQLLDAEQLRWLRQFSALGLSDDEAKALILARETGAVDNAGLLAVTGLDTLAASQVLRKLHHQRQLLVQGGSGSATYYQLRPVADMALFSDTNSGDLCANSGDLCVNSGDLTANVGALPTALVQAIEALTSKARKEKLWIVIVWICAIQAHGSEQLAVRLGRQVTALKRHLYVLRDQRGLLQYTYPEVVNHPQQAYIATDAGRAWLVEQGVTL